MRFPRGSAAVLLCAATFANGVRSRTSSSIHRELALCGLCFHLQLQLFIRLLCVFTLKAVHFVPFLQMKLADTF